MATKQPRSKREKKEAGTGTGENGHDEAVASYEQELAGYLQERIRPGLNRGAIPLLARSIAKEIAHREHPDGTPENADLEDEQTGEAEDGASAEAGDEQSAEAEDDDNLEAEDEDSLEAEDEDSLEAEDDGEPSAEAEDEQSAESDPASAFEDEMHELQADLGEDWILRFSVQGDDAWLTAEKDDGSQHVEAPTAEVLVQAVELLNESGGRSS
jgi:hypothetical protein